MSKHDKQDDKDKYTDNGHKPGPIPPKDSGGKHGKPETDDKDDKDERK